MLRFSIDLDFHDRIPVARPHNLVWDSFDLLLDLFEFATHKPFDGIDGVARIGDGLSLGCITDDALSRFGKGHD